MTTEPLQFRALPDDDYRHRIGIVRADVADFFAPSPDHAAILAERQRWLLDDPHLYAALLPAGAAIADEFTAFAADWLAPLTDCAPELVSLPGWLQLGGRLAADLVWLAPQADGALVTVGGIVCFPSSWSLPEKLGLTVSAIHDVVPDLNPALGTRIDKFLAALKPGESWVRSNWGAAASPERNQHPARNIPALQPTDIPDRVWLRREHQLLLRLPETRGIVFGIHIEQTSLTAILSQPELARRWQRSLATMSDEMLAYKRLANIQRPLCTALAAASFPNG